MGEISFPRTAVATAKWNLLPAFGGDDNLRKPPSKVVWWLWVPLTVVCVNFSEHTVTWKRHSWWVCASGMESGLTCTLDNDFLCSLLLYFRFFKSKAMQNACSRWTSCVGGVERQWCLPVHNYRCLLARVSREMGLCYKLKTLKIKPRAGSQFHPPWLDLCAESAAGFLLCSLFSRLWLSVLLVHLSSLALPTWVLSICLTFLREGRSLDSTRMGLRGRISLSGAQWSSLMNILTPPVLLGLFNANTCWF